MVPNYDFFTPSNVTTLFLPHVAITINSTNVGPHANCTKISVCRGGVPSYGFFSSLSNGTTLFSHVAITIHSTHANSRNFLTLDAFSRVS